MRTLNYTLAIQRSAVHPISRTLHRSHLCPTPRLLPPLPLLPTPKHAVLSALHPTPYTLHPNAEKRGARPPDLPAARNDNLPAEDAFSPLT